MAAATKSASGRRERKAGPVFAKTYFPVQIALFEHENDGKLNHSVKLTRSFRRDEQSDWETTEYLGAQDLLSAARLLGEAYDVIQSRLNDAYRNRDGAGETRNQC